jgi:hypothetical protein
MALGAFFAPTIFADEVHWSFTGRGVGLPCANATLNNPIYCSYEANLPFTFSGAYYTSWVTTTSQAGVTSVNNLWAKITIPGIGAQFLPDTTLDSFQVTVLPYSNDPNWRSGIALFAQNFGTDVWAGNVPAYDLRSTYTSGPVTAALGEVAIGNQPYAFWDLDAVNPDNPVKTVEFRAVADTAPEPVSWGLAGLGLFALALWRGHGCATRP